MVTLGNGAALAGGDQISAWAPNLLQVRPGQRSWARPAGWRLGGSIQRERWRGIATQIGGVARWRLRRAQPATLVANGRNW